MTDEANLRERALAILLEMQAEEREQTNPNAGEVAALAHRTDEKDAVTRHLLGVPEEGVEDSE